MSNTSVNKKEERAKRRAQLAALRAEAVAAQVVTAPAGALRAAANNRLHASYAKLLVTQLAVAVLSLLSYIPVAGWIFLYGPVKYGRAVCERKFLHGQPFAPADSFSGFSRKTYGRAAAAGALKCFLLLGWSLLLVIPALEKSIEYALVFYALAEDEKLTAVDALNRSRGLMKGNVPGYLKAGAPYFGLFAASVVTAFIGWLFVDPYYIAFKTEFYGRIKEGIEADKPEPGNIVEVHHLKKYFPLNKDLWGRPGGYVRAVDDVTLKIPYGTTLGVVGESGCGKTTLGRTLLGLYELSAGSVWFEGRNTGVLTGSELDKIRTDLQVIFQDPYSSLSPRMPIGEIIGEGVRVHNIVPKSEQRQYVLDIMQKCGLRPQYYDRYPHEFSGGQRQRICIARALAVKPKFVVCDEPVSALDVSIQAQVINLLKSLQKEMNLTYMFISHDLSVVEYISDFVAVMYLGSLVETGNTSDIFSNPLHPYTKALFSAVPVADPNVKIKRIILEGDIPSPANPPKGCKFHTRCNVCMEICKNCAPQAKELSPGHVVYCHLYD